MGDSVLSEGLLLGLGNPLLDISVNTDHSVLEKYDLKPNDAILAGDKHMTMYKDLIDNFKVGYTAGGACQNAMVVAQWILQNPKVCAFMGCIGKDEYGKILESEAKKAGVLVSYQYHDTIPTGKCACVITNQGANRSLCADLSAASCFNQNHFDNPANQLLINKAKYYYVTGYFFNICISGTMQIAKHACEYNKAFCMNLSSPLMCELTKDHMMEVLLYVDLLFGNEQEALTFSKEHEFETEDIKEIASRIQKLPKKNSLRPRVVIFTQGQDPVLAATDSGVSSFPVNHVKPEEIVDTNGAGDGFAGGFLAQYIQDKPLEVCIKCGIYAATEIIKQSGCTLPAKQEFVA